MRKLFYSVVCSFGVVLGVLSLSACDQTNSVSVRKNDEGQYRLFKNNEEFYIKGIGGHENLAKARQMGANSLRIWGLDNAMQILDSAKANNLMVLVGLWVPHERHGFDYNDSVASKKQVEIFREKIKEIKDHPALLMWAVGNEVDLAYTNTKVWDVVNDIALMLKEEDGKHPVTTVTAGLDEKEVELIKSKCPAIDIYGINTYGEIEAIPDQIREYGWNGPYFIGEWGPTGHWETDSTSWGVPIEETSREKAEVYKRRYVNGILRDSSNCIGSYVFLWGQKQETTPTWYGVFTEKGEATEVVDVLDELWGGNDDIKLAPRLDSVFLNGQTAHDNIYIDSSENTAEVFFTTDEDDIKIFWEILPESTDKKMGGDRENRPGKVTGLIQENGLRRITFTSPEEQGPYRLFVYVTDNQNKVALANIPFFVEESKLPG